MENIKEKKKKRLKTDAEGAQAAVEWHRSSHCHGDGSLDGAVGSWSNSPQPSTMTSRCLRQSSCLPFPSRSRTARVALSGISSRNSGMVWCRSSRECWSSRAMVWVWLSVSRRRRRGEERRGDRRLLSSGLATIAGDGGCHRHWTGRGCRWLSLASEVWQGGHGGAGDGGVGMPEVFFFFFFK